MTSEEVRVTSRRNEMLSTALDAFAERGYDGTSIADLAEATGLSKAAFSYHFDSKDDILVELAEPLLSDLEAVVEGREPPGTAVELRSLLDDYIDALLRHRTIAVWVDGDKSVASHPSIGARLDENNREMRILLAGRDASRRDRVRASAVLGAIWRPIRNLTEIDVAAHKDEIVTAVLDGVQPGPPVIEDAGGGDGVVLDAPELARASGLEQGAIDRLVAAGVLTADPSGAFRAPDITRARLVLALVEAGLPLEELADAIGEARLSFDYVDLLMPEPVRFVPDPPTDLTRYRELLLPILGGEQRADGAIRADELAMAEVLSRAAQLGAPEYRMVRIARAMAMSAQHLVDLQRDFIDDVLLDPAIDETGSPIAALTVTAPARLEFRDLGRRLIALLLERLVDDAVFKNVVQLTEVALHEGGISGLADGQSVVFVDVSGYTRRSQEEGDAAAAHQAVLLADLVHSLAGPLGGRLVRSLGDGALAHFPDPTSAVRFALDAVEIAPARGVWNLHAGVNTGPMLRRNGDFYGTAVNIASRVADQATRDRVVVTRAVVDAWSGGAAVSFTPVGSVKLKNVAQPVELFEATARP